MPAVAGMFYPEAPADLESMIHHLLTEARSARPAPSGERVMPRALIVPHAGLIYSGPVAASAYTLLAGLPAPRRVVLLGPSHRIFFLGIAQTTARFFKTPLGDLPVDTETVSLFDTLPGVAPYDPAHAREHSLEVQLPFLKVLFGSVPIVPLVVGEAPADVVAGVVETALALPDTLLLISTDLSHYQSSKEAVRLDGATARTILSKDYHPVENEMACGSRPLNGFLIAAHQFRLRGELLDLRNSGDTAGPKNEVVGYGAFAFWNA